MNEANTLGFREQMTPAIARLNAAGGMGAVAPMKRSAAAVEQVAHSSADRVTGRPRDAARVARHDKQTDGGELMRCARAGRAA